MIGKQMQKHIPYTYLIGWSKLDRFYYGVQYGKGSKNSQTYRANPDNLWTVYFTSSKLVTKYRQEFGEPDVIQVRKIFRTAKAACMWEEKVLKRLAVLSDERWLNQSIGGERFRPKCSGKEHHLYGKKRPKHAELMREKSHFRTIKFVGENNHFFGKTHTEETKQKMKLSKEGVTWSERFGETISNELRKAHSERMTLNNPFRGKHHTEKTKQKLRDVSRRKRTEEERKKVSIRNKNSIWVTNGVDDKLILSSTPMPVGFYLGRTKALKDKMWITNGIQRTQVSRNTSIPDGWRRGLKLDVKVP